MATVRGLKKRALRVRSRWIPYSEVRLINGDRITVDLRDEGGLHLAVWGSERAQPIALRAWQSLIDELDWDVILDVGGNYGEFAIPAVRKQSCPVIVIEPNPAVVACLARSLATSTTESSLIAAAAGAEPALAKLRVDGNSRIGQTVAEGDGSTFDVAVPVVTVDQVVDATPSAKGEGRRVLMKIDVEGSELEVIRGAREMLEEAARVVLLVETIHVGLARLREALSEYSAWAFDRRGGGFVLLDDAVEQPPASVDTRDVLFTRNVSLQDLMSGAG